MFDFNPQDFAKDLLLLGALIILLALLIIFRDKFTLINKVGQLSGDIYIRSQNFSFYFPITTTILISVIITTFFWIFRLYK